MSSVMSVIFFGLGLLFLYGFGVFAMCLHAGENLLSAATQASAWWAAFSISHLIGYMAITLH
ncbi:MAG: hypothetical protein HZB47_00770 [Nitrosomonadales bacterium]|nr:hypothetical protein [Nitrosomonadales bacterium]